MDDSYPGIEFDMNGQCNCCRDALFRRPHEWWPDVSGRQKLEEITRRLRERGRGNRYDALIGLSGGIDSAFLAHIMHHEYGLRLLAVHVDGGWNTAAAVRNIELLVRGLNVDLHTYVVEWDEMRDVQLAFLRASVVNQDIPQDHAFFATLYRTAVDFGLGDFLSGVNFASENIMLPALGHPSIDGRHLQAVHARFGTRKLQTFPVLTFPQYLWMTRVRRQLSISRPLDYLPYNKELAKIELTQRYGWQDYGGKHCESRFTRFYQEIYLPRKFNFDKRRLHLSSLIVSGQLDREEALRELAKPIVDQTQGERDIRYVAKKLGISANDLHALVESPPVAHRAYPNSLGLHGGLLRLRRLTRSLRSKRQTRAE